MVNNRATYQRQSWIPEAPTDEQVLFIPAASDNNCPVPAIFEEHKLYFNLCIISFMFSQDPDNHTTWDICQADRPNTCDIDQGMCDALQVPITILSDADITRCENHWVGQQRHQVPHATWGNLLNKGKCLRI